MQQLLFSLLWCKGDDLPTRAAAASVLEPLHDSSYARSCRRSCCGRVAGLEAAAAFDVGYIKMYEVTVLRKKGTAPLYSKRYCAFV